MIKKIKDFFIDTDGSIDTTMVWLCINALIWFITLAIIVKISYF